MAVFACGFAIVLSETRDQDTEHGYPISYI